MIIKIRTTETIKITKITVTIYSLKSNHKNENKHNSNYKNANNNEEEKVLLLTAIMTMFLGTSHIIKRENQVKQARKFTFDIIPSFKISAKKNLPLPGQPNR